MSDSRIQFPAMVSGASLAGTCLMQTIMFIGAFLFGAISHAPHYLDALKLRCFAQDDTRGKRRMPLAGRLCHLPDQRLKMSAALVPPNPKELESAYSSEALRAWFGT